MPTADEILASLTDEESEETEETEEQSPENENRTIAEIRKSQRSWERKAKALAKQVDELSQFKSQVETSTKSTSAREVLGELGLSEKAAAKQAELFLKVHDGEVTPETVRAFAVEYGLVDEDEAGEETPAPSTERKGFEPGGPKGSPAGSTSELMSRDDWEKLYFRDKDAAMRLAQAGKVDMSGIHGR